MQSTVYTPSDDNTGGNEESSSCGVLHKKRVNTKSSAPKKINKLSRARSVEQQCRMKIKKLRKQAMPFFHSRLYFNQYYVDEKQRQKFNGIFTNDAVEFLMGLRYENIDLEKVDLDKERKILKGKTDENFKTRKRFISRYVNQTNQIRNFYQRATMI